MVISYFPWKNKHRKPMSFVFHEKMSAIIFKRIIEKDFWEGVNIETLSIVGYLTYRARIERKEGTWESLIDGYMI